MRNMLKTMVLAGAVLALALTPVAQAQEQYQLYKTFISIQNTNVAGATTNIANIGGASANYLTVTKWGDFDLQVIVGVTNAATGSIDLNWTTSDDGVNWANGGGGSSGWFSVPLTNAGTAIVWRTNIVTGAGFYRLGFATNAAVQHVTNLVIRAYVKPRRYGGFGP